MHVRTPRTRDRPVGRTHDGELTADTETALRDVVTMSFVVPASGGLRDEFLTVDLARLNGFCSGVA